LIQIYCGNDIPESTNEKLHELGLQAYGEQIFTHPGYDMQRFERSHECFVVAYDGDKLIGAWCVYSLKLDIIKKMYNENTIYDDNIKPEWILPLSKENINYLMGIDMIVDKDYRGQGISKLLMNNFKIHIKKLKADGYPIYDKLVGYVINEGGKHLMQGNCSILVKKMKDDIYLIESDLNELTKGI